MKGITIHPSPYPVKETIDKLLEFLRLQGVTIYARIDQQMEVEKAGLKIGALEYLLFGNPKGGGPVMQANPVAALDLPLKIIAWEDTEKKVWLAYNEAAYIQDRYALPTAVSAPLNLDALIAKVLQ